MKYHFDDFALNGITGLSEGFPDVLYLLEGKRGLNLVAVFLVEWFHLLSLSLFRTQSIVIIIEKLYFWFLSLY